MRWILIGAIIFFGVSCATLSNRRDLYRPDPDYKPFDPERVARIRTNTGVRKTPHLPVRAPIQDGPITVDEEPVLPPP
jgi:hypothetical protein